MFIECKRIILGDDEKVLVLSNLHLGLDGEDFSREKKLLKYLKSAIKMYDYIILNGDVFETWEYRNYEWKINYDTDKLVNIFNNVPGLKDFLYKCNVLLIHGNHDYSLKKYNDPYITVSKYIDISAKNKEYHIEHGNNADQNYNNKKLESNEKSLITTINNYYNNKILPVLHRFNLIKLDEDSCNKINNVVFTSCYMDKKIFENYANTFNEYDVVILGHLHYMKNKKLSRVRYINSGDQLTQMEGVVLSNNKDYLIRRKY